MAIKRLSIQGLRGFATQHSVDFSIPNGSYGSGITVLVGPNNGGKSTVIESIRALSIAKEQSFTVGKRNQKAGDKVQISLVGEDNNSWKLKTVNSGGSECVLIKNGDPIPQNSIFVLPSRRFFNPMFSKGMHSREQHIGSSGLPTIRSSALNEFSNRLFQIQKNREEFDNVLGKVLTPVPKWTIDQSDGGQYFLKYDMDGSYHNSDGLGEGIISLFFIIDALYDSKPGHVIVIDEPELSLHPPFQRRLSGLLGKYATDRPKLCTLRLSEFQAIAIWNPSFCGIDARKFWKKGARLRESFPVAPLFAQPCSLDDAAGMLRNRNSREFILRVRISMY